MKPLLNEFCCLAPLRSGCLIIAFFEIVTASTYLFGYFTRQFQLLYKDNHVVENEHFLSVVTLISLVGCAFNYIIAVVLIAGIYKDVLILILTSALLLLVYTVFELTACGFAVSEDQLPVCFSLFIYAMLQAYFSLVVYSYYIEIKEQNRFWASMSEAFRAELEQERTQAKELGLPDPMKAALHRYRDLEEDGTNKMHVNTITETIPTSLPVTERK